jgi:localization factor PodJL
MTLGEWLNQMIIEGGDGDAPFYPPEPEPARRPVLQAGPQHRAEPVRRAYDEPTPASEHELSRITRALDAFSARLEAAEHRSTLAISGIDQSVMGVLSRLDGVEREQTAIGAGFEGSLDEVRATQAKLADRLRRMEDEEGPRVEAMKALEAALAKAAAQIYEGESRTRGSIAEVRQDLSGLSRRVDRLDSDLASKADAADRYTSADMVEAVVARINERLDQAESRTSAAVRALETSFAGLDDRLRSAETRMAAEAAGESPEHRFQRLAADLSERFEASRAELADQLRAAADGKLDRMESALHALSSQVEAAERKSADAIDRMGREVVRIAQTLGQRITTVDNRSAKAAEQMGSEMARIAKAMESRMGAAEQAQAQALEKLGGEIGRIAERLAERIAASERRSSAALDEVGDQVARVTDKVNQRHERTAAELSDRIRQSEERTARLLEEARETIDRRLAEAQRRTVVEAATQPPPPVAGFDDEPFAPPAASRNRFDPNEPTDPFGEDPFAEPEPAAFAAPEPAPPAREAEDEPPPLAREPMQEAYAPPPPAFDEPEPQDAPQGRTSTRELIEAARAAARQAAASDGRRRSGVIPEDIFASGQPAPPMDEPESPRGLGALGGFRVGKKKKKKETGTTLRTAVLASTTAAFLAASATGFFLVTQQADNEKAEPADAAPAPAPQATAAEPAPAQPAEADFLAAALTPAPESEPEAPAAEEATPAPARAAPAPEHKAQRRPAKAASAPIMPTDGGRGLYSAAVRRIESGDNTGVEALRRSANLGYAPAQFYLAKLYEGGAAGLHKDLTEARRWTERAAGTGDPKAMHNLGLYYFEGVGGEKNPVTAALWFQRAANAGLGDSQYNLARLYEQGFGVAQNPSEAYKWYLIAAAGGDKEAKEGAERVRKQLSADSQAAAQRSASNFRPQQGPALASR